MSDLLAREGKQLLLGNEAIVRGLFEAGVDFASTYPGTPSSEIGNLLEKLASDAGMYFEFSTNEKVAMEVSAAAASSGLRSFVFMKHVGLNVAADPMMTLAYSGVTGGMLILTATTRRPTAPRTSRTTATTRSSAFCRWWSPPRPPRRRTW